ncbi:MAG: D-glycero-beta-D-manno-heptose-7-phosphate kinase [Candidatus Omnitrophica bacterium]|nr:D-glycero-beta-D-manno-heptose-7-phosphate kinase [Candidatus Omnitrophota bacterium]MBU4478814.1 D-glycero-beta-D-manno-heptose-7-phosphate kinase [Candidatus Omnitrophota bacterium]MCG2703909.1 D-glycero-beta-D-manno-heptose-7-phosphate kinase [Candidatus Omnitrophota bacterium]
MSIARDRLTQLLQKFEQKKIVVIGDLILDQYIWGDVSRISPEAPVPVVLVEKESFMPGGAANVAASISALEGNAVLAGVIGNDSGGKILKSYLRKNADVGGVFVDAKRKTSIKIRIVARRQQVVRVDKEVIAEIRKEMSEKILAFIERKISSIDAIIIEDYGKGVINPFLIKAVVAMARKHKVLVTVDPKEDHFSYYSGVTCLTPNQHEAEKAAGIVIVDIPSLLTAGKKLLKKLRSDALLITRGEHGMCLFERGKKAIHIPTRAQEVFDVSGAGDTVIGAFTLALAGGASLEEAAHISNYAAGVVVGKVGVSTCSQRELLQRVDQDLRLGAV